jgi:bacillopeptidase F
MKAYTLFIFCIICSCFFSNAQQLISPKLAEKIANAGANDKIIVRIEFKDNVNCFALKNEFNQQKMPANERVNRVVLALQKQANLSQHDLLLYLESHPNKVSNIHSLWLVNLIVCEMNANFVHQIEQFPSVALIDFENGVLVNHDPVKVEQIPSNQKSIGGVEPGLEDINVRPLWNLGYTGRGLIVFDYDTGVWPSHPAIANRFLAHYKPMSQSWHGYHSPIPNGTVDNHGTHTMGTIAGLDTFTNDTTGVAFNAYWIANDLIGTTTASMPPLVALIESFEWAMNPDGNLATADDVPAVINNSWRWYDGNDTNQCAGNIVGLMNSVEAAGIANVFAGGNFGPSNTTVSAPQRINTTEVNTFSVGAVDGNQSFPYPIAGFSSRGPKQCPAPAGPLLIHPEVVAPGVNVRSSYGTSGYAVLSGTSMATPHVSGAVLLLKEAFPYLTGEDLLWALYLTAVDLGDPGEDNVYGRGMIDVYAAYQYLATTNTPVNPMNITNDVAVEILSPTDDLYTCDTVFSPSICIKNLGTANVNSIHIYFALNGQAEQMQIWNGSLGYMERDTVLLPILSSNLLGNNQLKIRIEIDPSVSEYDNYNNQYIVRFNIRPGKNLPFFENFEGNYYDGDWHVYNPDGAYTWQKDSVPSMSGGDNVISIPMYLYVPVEGQKDRFISPKINLPAGESIHLKFDWAYYRRTHALIRQDSLHVLILNDCETTVLGKVLDLYADSLETGDTLLVNFTPKSAAYWKTKEIDISQFAGQQISIAFESVNRNGNNLFIDNIGIYSNNHPLSIKAWEEPQVLKLFPNPNNGNFTITISTQEKGKINVYNTLGKKVLTKTMDSNKIDLGLNSLENGLYIVEFSTGNNTYKTRFVKN